MSTKGKSKNKAIAIAAEQVDAPRLAQRQPRIRDYMLAILQLLFASIKKHGKLVMILVLIVVIGFVGFKTFKNVTKNPALTEDELIISISKQLNINGDPNPAILTVIDREKTNQPFLDESRDGDKVLLYYKASKAVLYRPKDAKIIKSGAFTAPAAQIQIRQGTTTEKRVTDVTELLKKVPNTKVKTRDDSLLTNYTQTLVINVTNRYDKETEAVAKALGATVRTPPQTETVPDADILVIVGSK